MSLSPIQKNILIYALIIGEPALEHELMLEMPFGVHIEKFRGAIKELANNRRCIHLRETSLGYEVELTPEGKKEAKRLIEQSKEKYVLSALIDKSSEDRYSLSIVCYIDILGFSKIVKNLKGEQLHEFINKMRLAFSIANREEYAGKWPEEYQASQFSDSVIMSSPLEGNNFLGIIRQVSHFQGSLSLQGLFVRGAITIGQHYQKENMVVSPALIEAYQLSETKAVYPRVILDKSIFSRKIEIYDENDPFLPNPRKFYSDIVRMDSDGYYFVNYLETEVGSADCSGDGSYYLKYHKDAILNNVRRNETDSRILAKMAWLAKQHNRLIYERQKRHFDKFENKQLINLDEICIK